MEETMQGEQNNNSKLFLMLGGVLILIIALTILVNKSIYKSSSQDSQTEKETATSTTKPTEDKEGTSTIVVNATNYKFDPTTIIVKKGETVTIVLKNQDGLHDLKIDEFNVATKKLRGGEEETISFVADKSGTFEYYCSVGQHRAMGMKGSFVVQE